MVFSVTPFLDELDILEIRLATLDNVVDVHVICEASTTHTGKPKPLILPEHGARYEPWIDKIRYVPCELADGEVWDREHLQRQALIVGLKDVQPEDRILLSDCDEIPHPAAVRDAAPGTHLMCRMHGGRLNWRWTGPPEEGFTISRILDGATLHAHDDDLQVIRELPWAHDPKLPVGWHLSYMSDVRAKLDSFAHTEMTADDQHIHDFVHQGKDLFGRDYRDSEWVDLDQLPPYVAENRERFEHLLIPRPEGTTA